MKEYIRQHSPALFSILKAVNQLRKNAKRAVTHPIRIARQNRRKRLEAVKIAPRHAALIEKCRGKTPLRVLFIALHRSVWKTDEVFRVMQADPDFDPSIFVAPTLVGRDLEWSVAEQREALTYFVQKGYDARHSPVSDGPDAAIQQIIEIAPDLIFFTNHHTLTFPEFYQYLLDNHLTCYVPYSASVSRFNDYQTQYNQLFHNLVWRIFAPHSVAKKHYRRVQAIAGTNVNVTGYPAFEPLVSLAHSASHPWKPLGLKRVIWAPHHTIDMPSLPYANFLRYSELFKELVEAYSDRIQWCFKPHPLLKPKLINDPDWGPERTLQYYNFWSTHANTQLELGEYADLFIKSDAMIHDSGSFLAEYLYVDKPVMFLWSSPQVTEYINEFGLEALAASQRGDDQADIRRFLDSVASAKDDGMSQRRQFLDRHPVIFDGLLPSERIIRDLKYMLSGDSR